MRYQPSDFPLRDPNEAKFVVSQIFDIRMAAIICQCDIKIL